MLCVQFHSNYVTQFMKLMGEFVRFSYGLSPREKERYPSAETTLLFADTLCRLGNISRAHLDGKWAYSFDLCTYLTKSSKVPTSALSYWLHGRHYLRTCSEALVGYGIDEIAMHERLLQSLP
eukprot:COSAG02_NODE_20161_length_846_cov_0.848728_2_plen_122_part_00